MSILERHTTGSVDEEVAYNKPGAASYARQVSDIEIRIRETVGSYKRAIKRGRPDPKFETRPIKVTFNTNQSLVANCQL